MIGTEIHRCAYDGDLLDGGWILFLREDGTYEIEGTTGPEREVDSGEVVAPWETFNVFMVPVPLDVYAEHNWLAPTREERENGRSEDVIERAEELASIAKNFGWSNLDHAPRVFSAKELRDRWDHVNTDKEATGSDFYDALIGANMEAFLKAVVRSVQHRATACDPLSAERAQQDAEKIADGTVLANIGDLRLHVTVEGGAALSILRADRWERIE